MALRDAWRRFADLLRGARAREERVRAADREHVLARARAHAPLSPEVAEVWPIVLLALDHQGWPRENLDVMLGALEGTNRSCGWDEFSIDHDPAVSSRVELGFIHERASCEAAELLRELRGLRASL